MSIKYKIMCAIACVAACANTANALDLGELQDDVVYNYDAMTPVSGYYVPKESGIITCHSTGGVINAYEDENHANPIESQQSLYGPGGEKIRIYPATAGKTIYFYNVMPLDGGTFRISTGNEKIELSSVTPKADDNLVSLSTNYRVDVLFNIPIKCTRCTLSTGDENIEMSAEVSDASITVYWFNTLRQLYREGKIKAGDEVTLTFTGIRDAYNSGNRPDFGDGVGKLVLRYKMNAQPAELTRETGTPNSGVTDFLTYYMPGSDRGLVSLIFDRNLDPKCKPSTELLYGDIDNVDAQMYRENPLTSIEGNKLTVNLQGVTRFPEEMIPGLPAQKTISLRITGIKSEDGQYVLTGSMSSPYSFGYSYNFKRVVYSIAADWLPLAGSQLATGTDMEIWVLNGNHIKFDTVDFHFIKDGAEMTASVPYDDITATKDSETDMLYNLKAPAMEPDADTEITVTFGGLMCEDGLDHSNDIFVRYKSATSGVASIEETNADKDFYDLLGRRILNPGKGIYVQGGRKIVTN